VGFRLRPDLLLFLLLDLGGFPTGQLDNRLVRWKYNDRSFADRVGGCAGPPDDELELFACFLFFFFKFL
jgi:hypothetical protein